MDIRQSAIDRTKGFESFIPHLYKDTTDNVTVGWGHMVADGAIDDVAMMDGAAVATNPVKEAAFNVIDGKPKGKKASWYAQFTTIRMAQDDADDQFTKDLTQSAKDLLIRFPALDSYPNDAQDALLDMMFNIGLTRFTAAVWTNFFPAVLAQDWTTAATESHRSSASPDRNDQIKALFLSAAGAKKVMLETTAGISAIDRLVQDRLDAITKLAAEAGQPGKLFPQGITHIHLCVSAAGAKFELDISGPPTPAA